MTKEIYKDVVGYEGIYQVSNLGNVKRILLSRGVHWNHANGNILKPFKETNGYLQIGLLRNGKRKYFMHHRLIAQAFIDNPNNYPCINHINGIKTDNRIENLEWCTHSQNIIHAYSTGLINQPKGNDSKKTKKIIDIETGEIYPSVSTLSLKLGVNKGTLQNWLNNHRPNKTTFRYL
jgi:hypothetical protein